ncbi:MAG: iron-sulfur cluster repair di-iron protein, ric [Christensenellales bacterium]
MDQQKTFGQAMAGHLKKLAQYVPIVDRVHGENHPEFHEVRDLTVRIIEKTRVAGKGLPQLEDEFARLRIITGGYLVPGDVCESYEAVYQMLGDLDRAYGGKEE